MAQYHVTLDGQGYLIDLASYHKGVAPALVAKTRTGDPGYGDFAVSSVWAQQSWRGGLRSENSPLPSPLPGGEGTGTYEAGVAIDPTGGDLRLGRSLTSVYQPTGVAEIYALCAYRGFIYAIQGDGGKVWRSTDGASWSEAYDSGASSLQSIALFNGWLIVGSGADGKLFSYDGTTWSLWTTLSGTAVRALQSWAPSGAVEHLYVGVSQADNRSALIRVTTGASATTLHQPQLAHIEAIGIAGGRLWYCALSDGPDVHGELFSTDAVTWEHVASIPDNAITSFALYRDQLFAGSRTRGKVWTVSARGLDEVWNVPDVVGVGGISTYAQPIRGLVVDNDRLHVPVVDTQGLGTYVYYATGGSIESWSLPNTGGLGQEARGLAAFGGKLYLSTKSSGGARVYRMDGQYAATGIVVTNWFDAALAATDKVWVRCSLFHVALESGQSVTVDYALDGSSTWVNLGTSSSVGATTRVLSFPIGTAGKRVHLRLTLATTDRSASPRVTAVLVDYLLTPDVKRQWQLDVLLEGAPQSGVPLVRLDNTPEPLDGRGLAATLWASRGRKQALAFVDLDGTAAMVWFRDLEERPAQMSQRQGLATRGRVTLSEV